MSQPIAKQKLKRGTIRSDGMVFVLYVKNCKNGEWWVSQDKFQEMNERNRFLVRKRRSENPEKYREYERSIRKKNPERYKQQKAIRRKNNLSKIRQQENASYYRNKKNKIQAQTRYQKQRSETDFIFRESKKIKNLVSKTFRDKGYSKKSRVHDILGCSYEEFLKHIQGQFLEGMNWDNRNNWHLDHIIPISLAKTYNDIIASNHYTNFQPLWAIDNIRKGNKIIK
jgi:hypothetical protein